MSSLTQMWASLGVAFHSDSTKVSTSPEEGIISFLKSGEFPKDRILLPLILGWLKENSKIVHVERLKNLSIHLSDFEAALLGVMAKKCVQNKDHRWNSIIKFVKEKIGEKIFEEGDSEVFLSVKGQDKDFAEFGLKFAPISIEKVGKKLRPRKFLIETNSWIKNRVLFGTNVRADIATIRELGLAETAYRASKIAACSMNAAYNNWCDLEEVNWFSEKKTSA